MLCEKCKSRIATIHMTEIVNGTKREVHLCERCVEKDLIIPYFKMSFEELFEKITSKESVLPFRMASIRSSKPGALRFKRCWACKSSFGKIELSTEFGCANDYVVFTKEIERVLKENNNDNYLHSGKLPNRSLQKTRRINRLMLLNFRMENAVKSENYELAATLRDELKNI